ncbi:FAST kinase domain-containing protein 5, mitochondrial [Echinops telfairi]|uniref:FAST kinase domain-containing protein 5, mitochondrial n=1 Tax=Echinops telfairi TaxID=9371 RepID=A0ABM0J9T1_ECHTE|nr:FAST kinase domain-containing protein 5, mitochondrial [Echinops telfairi]
MAAIMKLLRPVGCQVFCGPFAYNVAQSMAYWNLGSGTLPGAQNLAKHVESIHSAPSSQRCLATSRTLLGLEFNKTKVGLLPPDSPSALRVGKDVKVYDSFKVPRTFLQLRPEYQLHSYHRSESGQPLSVSEGELILHEITVYRNHLQPQVLADYFRRLSSLPAEQHPVLLSSPSFALLCQLSVKNIQLFDTPDLMSILKAFVTVRVPPSHPMLDVYETQFCHQVWEMSLDQLLLVADLWRNLGHRVPRFFKIFFSYLNFHWKDLSLPQLIHLIYIIGENRQAPQDLMQKLESLILKYIDLINLEELGTICLGFFKSSSSLSEFVMRKMGDLACAEMQRLSSPALVNILKMFRFTHVDHTDFMKQFGQIAPQRIPSMSVQGAMHLTLACSALRFLDEGVMNTVAATLPPKVAHCRSKDVAKILWSFGTLNYKPPNTAEFYSCLISEIHRKRSEFYQYPEHLFTCLLGLAFSEYFPVELIDFALSPGFVRLAQERSKFELMKELCTLDGTVGIECPDYRGNRLDAHLRQEGSEMLWNLARKDMCAKPEFLEALFVLETLLGGPQYIKHHMILPHTRSSDLEVQLDVNMKPLPFNSEATSTPDVAKLQLKHVGITLTDNLMEQLLQGKSRKHTQGQMASKTGQQRMEFEKRAASPLEGSLCSATDRLGTTEMAELCPQAHLQTLGVKLAIQLTNKNQYCYGSRHLLGLHNMKRRQLVRLGYRVVELAPWEWLPLLKRTRSEKLAFLHEKVFTSAL